MGAQLVEVDRRTHGSPGGPQLSPSVLHSEIPRQAGDLTEVLDRAVYLFPHHSVLALVGFNNRGDMKYIASSSNTGYPIENAVATHSPVGIVRRSMSEGVILEDVINPDNSQLNLLRQLRGLNTEIVFPSPGKHLAVEVFVDRRIPRRQLKNEYSHVMTSVMTEAANLELVRRMEFRQALETHQQRLAEYESDTVVHEDNVARLSVRLAKAVGVVGSDVKVTVYRGGRLHDIGKNDIPLDILLKPGDLTPGEREIMSRHTIHGHDKMAEYKHLVNVARVVRSHHEKWDGKGYPDGLRGQEIPLEARIVSVADVYTALREDRSYRKGLPHDEAIKIIENQSGTSFQPTIVYAFVEMMKNDALKYTN